MAGLHAKGPLVGDPNLVTYRKNHARTRRHEQSEFLVSIHLGGKLRDIEDQIPDETVEATSDHTEQLVSKGNGNVSEMLHQDEEYSVELEKKQSESSEPGLEHPGDAKNGQGRVFGEHDLNGKVDPPLWPTIKRPPEQTSDSDVELEIVEVRMLSPKNQDTSEEDDDDSDDDSDLSSLDNELNTALTSSASAATQLQPVSQASLRTQIPIHRLIPSLYKPVKPHTSPPPPGYRNIPPNLVNTIQRELNFFYDNGGDDDLEVVGKVVFSLKDPYSATKIKLPVKATTCRHFECFDFETFCVFHNIPHGVKHTLKKSLILKSNESRKNEQFFLKQQQQLANGTLLFKSPGLIYPLFSEHGQMFFSEVYRRTPPLYKCPLCDEKFSLKQLYISDIFNFLVKTTPLYITRIELVGADRYKILEDDTVDTHDDSVDLVVLSEDEELSENGEMGPQTEPSNKSFNEDFNDGLDDVLAKMSQEDGTWGNPVTLD